MGVSSHQPPLPPVVICLMLMKIPLSGLGVKVGKVPLSAWQVFIPSSAGLSLEEVPPLPMGLVRGWSHC